MYSIWTVLFKGKRYEFTTDSSEWHEGLMGASAVLDRDRVTDGDCTGCILSLSRRFVFDKITPHNPADEVLK